jgi:hypothetical protein
VIKSVFNDIFHCREEAGLVNDGMIVKLYEKQQNGDLILIDERTWNANMISSLDHVNFLTIGDQEYETVEGRLNLDKGHMELLVVPMRNK